MSLVTGASVIYAIAFLIVIFLYLVLDVVLVIGIVKIERERRKIEKITVRMRSELKGATK